MYFKKNKLYLTFALLGGLATLSSLQASSTIEGKMKSQIVQGCVEALEKTGLTYLTQSSDNIIMPLVNPAIAIGLDQNSLKAGGSITERLNIITQKTLSISNQTSEIEKKFDLNVEENLNNFNTLKEQNVMLFRCLKDLRIGQQVLFTKIMNILDAVAYSPEQFRDQFNAAKKAFLPSFRPVYYRPMPKLSSKINGFGYESLDSLKYSNDFGAPEEPLAPIEEFDIETSDALDS